MIVGGAVVCLVVAVVVMDGGLRTSGQAQGHSGYRIA